MSKSKSNNYYMHMLESEPAFFDGFQVAFQVCRGKAAPLCRDLRQIRREQKQSRANRAAMNMRDDFIQYDYRRVRLPETEENRDER